MDRLLFRCLDTLVDASALECRSFNTAFAESGLDWHWSDARFIRLKKILGERHRIAWYAEHVKGQPISCAHADKILWRKEQALLHLLQHDFAAPRPGVVRLLIEATARGIQTALAMPSTSQWPIFTQTALAISPLSTVTLLHPSAQSNVIPPDSIDFEMRMATSALAPTLIESCIQITSNVSGAHACITHFGEKNNPATLLSGKNVLRHGCASLKSLLALEASTTPSM